MDTATSRSMTALCRVMVCAEADDDVRRATASPSPNTPPLLRAQPRHSRSTPSAPTSSFRAQSRNPSPASQRISQRIQRPLHSTMDTATSRSMTALCRVTVCAEADDGVGRATASPSPNTPPLLRAQPRHSRSTPSAPTSSFRAQSRNPSPASQRISQRSQRPLHSTMDTATSRSMTALVFRGQSRNPSPASQRINQIIQRPLHSTMDTATSRSMTALVFRGQLRNPSPASQRISQRSQRPLHSTMDTATSRSMTALVFRGQLRNPVPLAPQLRHSAHSRTFLG